VRGWLESFGVRFIEQGDNGWVPDEPTDEAAKRWLTATLRSVAAVHGTRSTPALTHPNGIDAVRTARMPFPPPATPSPRCP
jgi:hypothetical protein